MTAPRFSCALSLEVDSRAALREALAELDAGLDGEAPHLVVAFVTHHHGELLETLGPELEKATGVIPTAQSQFYRPSILTGQRARRTSGTGLPIFDKLFTLD